MVAVYGMNDRVGNVSFYGMSQDQFNKPYSDDTATLIDDEVRNLVESQYDRAQELLTKYNKELHILAKQLLEKEVLVKSDVERLIGPRPWPEQGPFTEPEGTVEAPETPAENGAHKPHQNGAVTDSEEISNS